MFPLSVGFKAVCKRLNNLNPSDDIRHLGILNDFERIGIYLSSLETEFCQKHLLTRTPHQYCNTSMRPHFPLATKLGPRFSPAFVTHLVNTPVPIREF